MNLRRSFPATRLLPTVALFCLACDSLHAAALNLGEAQALLFEHHPDLQAAEVAIERAQSQWAQSRSAYLPKIDWVGNYQIFSEKNHLEFTLPPPVNTSISKDLGDYDRWETGLDVTYPIFTGFARTSQVESKSQLVAAEKARQKALRNQASLRLAALYYAWHMSRAKLAFEDAQCALAEGSLQVSQAQKAQGLVSERAVLTARSQSLAQQAEKLTAANQVDSLAWEAGQWLGMPGDIVWQLDTVMSRLPDELPDAGPASHDGADSGALRPEIQALQHQSRALAASEKAVHGRDWPNLTALAGWRYADPGLNLAGTEPMAYGLAGMQLKWNLFSGGERTRQREELRLQRRQIAIETSKLLREWDKNTALTKRQYKRWRLQTVSAQAALEAAERSLLDTRRQLDHGLATPLDTLEIRVQCERARMLRDQSLSMQKWTYCQWLYARGETLNFQP